jgi:hypothetical protein
MTERFIEWDRDRLVLAEGTPSGTGVSIRTVKVLDRRGETTDTLGLLDGLKSVFPSTSDKKRPSVVMVLPRQSVTILRIQLPQVPDAEVPDMIRMQATMKLTVPLESVCMDFTPLPSRPGSATRDVLLVTAPADLIATARRTLNDAGCDLAGVRVSAYCIAQALEHGGWLKAEADPGTVDVIALMRRDFMELTFVRGSTVVFSHSGNSWSSPDAIERTVRSELTRARLSAAEILGEHRIGRILLVGSSDVTNAVTEQLSTRFDQAKIERIDPSQTLVSAPSLDGLGSSDLLPIAGAILGEAKSSIQVVDLINPRKAPEKKDLRRVKVLASLLAIVAVFGGVYIWRKGKIGDLTKQLAIVDVENMDYDGQLEAGKPTLDLYEQLGNWSARDHSWLDRLATLKAMLPTTDRMFVKSFVLASVQRGDVGQVDVELYSKSEEDILQLERRLTREGYRLKPSKPSRKASTASPEYQWNAKLEIVIPEVLTPISDKEEKEKDETKGEGS